MADGGGWTEVNSKQKKQERHKRRQKEHERQRQKMYEQEDERYEPPTSPVHMPRSAAVKTAKNPFVVFEEKEPKKKPPAKPAAAPKKKKKKQPKKAADHSCTLSVEVLKKCTSSAAGRFPQNHNLQLRLLSEAMEDAFANTREYDPAQEFAGKATSSQAFLHALEPPLSYAPPDAVEWAVNWLAGIPKDDVEDFFWFLVKQVTGVAPEERISIPTNGNGLKALLQMMIRAQPQAISHSRDVAEFHERAREVMTDSLHSPDLAIQDHIEVLLPLELPHFVWLFGQFLSVDARPALYASEFTKSLVLLYITALLAQSGKKLKKRKLDKTLSRISFERCMHVAFSTTLSGTQLTQFTQIYQAIKVLTIHAAPAHYFPMLLSHAATDKGGERQLELREEVLTCLTHLLHISEECFRVWEDTYVHFIAQSNNLLLYIYLNWDSLSEKLPGDLLIERAEAFIQVNKDLRAGKYRVRLPKRKSGKYELNLSREDIKMCTITCKAVIRRIRKSKGMTLWVVVAIVAVVVAFYFICLADDECGAAWCAKFVECSSEELPGRGAAARIPGDAL